MGAQGVAREWVAQGDRVRVEPGVVHRIPDFDPRSGAHYWVVITVHQMSDPGQWSDPTVTPMLDAENLVSVAGPLCYHCEQPYTPLLAGRRCRGHG